MSRIDVHSEIPQDAAGRRRCFSIDEANRALVLVKRIVADVVASYARLVDLQEVMETAQVGGDYGASRRAQQDLMAVAKRLQGFARELDEVGVELKDWSAGVVDFPSTLDGREIYLCWRHGEARVDFWHELDQDPAQRQCVSQLMAPQGSLS